MFSLAARKEIYAPIALLSRRRSTQTGRQAPALMSLKSRCPCCWWTKVHRKRPKWLLRRKTCVLVVKRTCLCATCYHEDTFDGFDDRPGRSRYSQRSVLQLYRVINCFGFTSPSIEPNSPRRTSDGFLFKVDDVTSPIPEFCGAGDIR